MLKFFSEKIGFDHSINSMLIKYFDISVLCICRDLKIFKGKSLPAGGWFVYDMASFQNACFVFNFFIQCQFVYQIKGNHENSNMVASSLPTDPHPPLWG